MSIAEQSTVERFFSAQVKLPTFPDVASRLLRTFGNDRIGLEQMAELIGQDAALSAKVMRLANSARYSPAHTISRLRDAANALGTDTLRNLALAACLAETFPSIPGLDSRTFWRHAMASAQYAVLLARSVDIDSETAYIAGLMLRTGELIMLSTDAAGVVEVEAHAHEPGSRFDWENQRWHCSHTDVTAELSRRWRFPDTFTHAFAACAEPLEARPFSALGAVLHCAETMADAWIEGVPPLDALRASNAELIAHLHLDLDWVQAKLDKLGPPDADAESLLGR